MKLPNRPTFSTLFWKVIDQESRVFPRLFTHGGICSPHMGGHVQGDKVLIGGTHEGGHKPYMGEPNFDRLYHKLKVLLLLSCNYTMQFIGYNCIKTH